MCPHLILKFPK